MRRFPFYLCLLSFSLLFPGRTLAWVYPEHREITLVAILKLDKSYRARLEELWSMARKGNEARLDVSPANPNQGLDPQHIDYAAWPAVAGDHSVSSNDMVNNILYSDWILKVAAVTATLKKGLDESKNDSEREGYLRDSDIRLLRADPEYVSRAGSNNVHFMLARTDEKITAAKYFDSCMAAGAEINLVSTYAWYHASAMLKARRLATQVLTTEERSALALAVLADEAFALHFLEDAFSAGHIVGVRGNAALRKGTHDYYDENGVEVVTWHGRRMVLAGDAFMRRQDAERAAETVVVSIQQVIDAANLPVMAVSLDDRPETTSPDTLDIAKVNEMPPRTIDPAIRRMISDVLVTTPVPGLSAGLGEMPRFRSEVGPFIGIAPAARISAISGGFGIPQVTAGLVPSLEFAVHVGLGLDGVLNESGDGLVFLDLGWRLDGASSIKIEHDPSYKTFGSILSAIPTRDAFYTRIRMPYYVIPGDLLVLAPLLFFINPNAMNKVVATAGQGGLIPWQSGIPTAIGRFQFILGREVAITFYGSVQGPDAFLMPNTDTDPETYSFIKMNSTLIEVPVLEYRPVRTFSKRQSASILMQFYACVDIPGKVRMVDPSEPLVRVKTIWSGGVRLAFDWRFYYAKKRSQHGH